TILDAVATGGLPSPTYLWSGLPRGCTSANLSSLFCRPTSSGTFTVTVLVTDAAGSNATSTTQLVVHPLPVVRLTWSGNIVGCTGSVPSPTSFVANGSGGTPPFQFGWTFGDGGTATSNGSVIYQYHQLARFNVTVVGTDASGANRSAMTVVYVTYASCPPPTANASASFASNDWIEIGGAALVAAALVAAVLVVRRRRRSAGPPPAEEE
ncbi:MAG: PKD domain-containing protein, partial [Thermoplasmata archaeon]|nr:PKD domain-containing protein [Thermoplasmata archaeon]